MVMANVRITQKARAAAYRQLTARANGRAADLLPVIEELTAAGITSLRGIAAGLDERRARPLVTGSGAPPHEAASQHCRLRRVLARSARSTRRAH
jgi:hypothetical protein